jgi:hypothetical protein
VLYQLTHERVAAGESLEQVELLYKHFAKNVKLLGPTSFAPLIYRAIEIVRENNYGFHILVCAVQ